MKKLRETIGFIGCGNMGSAILTGLIRAKIVRPKQVFVYDSNRAVRRRLKDRFKVRVLNQNREVVRKSKIIILAIKPQDLAAVSKDLNGLFRSKLLISVLAGTPISKIRRSLGQVMAVVRSMPNLGAVVGNSMTALTGNATGLRRAEIIFSGCGETIKLPEKRFDMITAVSGSGPAYFFLLMEILANYARRNGLGIKDANLLASQTALASGQLAKFTGSSPAELRRKVTSKRGTTEAALKVLFESRTRVIFEKALSRAVMRARELSCE